MYMAENTSCIDNNESFKNAVKSGIIKQLYKDNYITKIQYSKILAKINKNQSL